MVHIKPVLLALIVAFGLAACEGDGPRSATPTGPTIGPIYCKSPVTGELVPKALALKLAQTVANVNNVTVDVRCDDPVTPVVEVTPVVINNPPPVAPSV